MTNTNLRASRKEQAALRKGAAMNARKKLIIGGVVAGVAMLLGAGLVLGAGVAKASPESNPQLSLLLDLRGDGFDISPPYDSRLLALADQTCWYLNQGASATSVINDLERQQIGFWAGAAAIHFVVDTQFDMCPWTLSPSVRPSTPSVPPHLQPQSPVLRRELRGQGQSRARQEMTPPDRERRVAPALALVRSQGSAAVALDGQAGLVRPLRSIGSSDRDFGEGGGQEGAGAQASAAGGTAKLFAKKGA